MCLKWLFTESSRVHGSFVNCCCIQQFLAFVLTPLYVFSAEIGFLIMVQLKHFVIRNCQYKGVYAGFLYAIVVQLYLQGMQLIVFSILSYVFMSSTRVETILS